MKFLTLFLFVFVYQSFSVSIAQEMKVTLDCKEVSLEQVIIDLKKQTNLNYFYKKNDLAKYGNISAKFKDEPLSIVLNKLLKETNLSYEIRNDIILITKSKKSQATQSRKIRGTVVDKKGEPLPGVTVLIKGTTMGVATDSDGKFVANLPKMDDISLVFTFVGMKTQTVKISDQNELKIVMEDLSTEVEEVVVNGYFKRSKETFTGASTTVTGDQIKQISNTNLIQALAALTPGMHVVENNAQGSNPNAIPQIIIRGTTSLVQKEDEDLITNNPLIVLDGVEISMEELYDLDLEDIDRIDVLKDAAATSIYGDQAANGVIVVTRKRVKNSKLKVRYNFTPNYAIPDITSINLTNARQKLELERLAGLYEKEDGILDRAYQKKLADVNNGVNTDWIAKPLRISLSHSHSLALSGRSNDLSYRISGSFKDSYGVMKGDNRQGYGLSIYLGYFKSKKLRVNFRSGFSLSKTKNSPYGDFSDYTKINPYNPVRDENGDYIRRYYFDPYQTTGSNYIGNPLYDASLSSYSKRKSLSVNNSVDLRWEAGKNLIVTSQLNYNLSFNQGDTYVSPDDSEFVDTYYVSERGSYKSSSSNRHSYGGKIGFNYRILFDDQSHISINGGAQFRKSKNNTTSATGKGFKKEWMNDLRFAISSESTGQETISSSVGFYGAMNMSFRQKYNFDFNARSSGSSKYGDLNKWGPFLSGGFSWNLHKETFLDYEWLNTLRFRVSTGYTGSSNFDPYQAITVYQYKENMDQYSGIGAVPEGMGNPGLKWQRTLNTNYGLNASILNNRLSFGIDFYTQLTKDVVMSISVPPSIGVDQVKVNYGEIENRGYDFSITGQIFNKKDLNWTVSVSASHVMDKLIKLSEELMESYNKETTTEKTNEPSLMLIEGGSQYGIYGVRSAGIDPATGKEIFIDRYGNYTYEYSELDRVELGNTNPTLRGSINSGIRYKNFSVNITSQYTFGSDKYNSTIFNRVENIDRYNNVDERAFTQRWKKPGDLTWFVGLREGSNGSSQHTSRFVQKFNEFYVSNVNFAYEFKPEFLKRLGVKKLRLGYGMTDVLRLSTVKFERGTSYPYNRTFNFTIRPTF